MPILLRPLRLPRALDRAALAAAGALSLALACGTPADPNGESGGAFGRASLQGGGGQESLVSTRSIELVSWLVQFNRLNSAEKLETALNKKPGQFFPVDADADGTADYIGVIEEAKAKRGAHALVLSAKPKESDDGTKVATLFFDGDWGFLGYERVGTGNPPSATTIAAAAGKAAGYAAAAPPAPPPTKASGGDTVTLSIAAGGLMTLGGETVGDDQLRDRIKAILSERPGVKVVVEADASISESQVTARIDALTDAGVTQLAIGERRGATATALARADAPSPVKAVGAGSEVDPGIRPAAP